MRPIKLEIEGFTVYRDRQVIDFSNLNFFIIKGKTGSGKTSIVDAITFALYGKVPRYSVRRSHHKMVMSRNSDRMRVSLEFSVGTRRYKVERFYRTKPESYEVRAYDGDKRLDLGKNEVERWVEKITGLDYRTFTKVIVLPQGEFDELLKPREPRERRNILIRLLDLQLFEEMRILASERFRQLTGEREALTEELERLKDVSTESIRALEKEKSRIEKNLKDIQSEITKAEEELGRAREVEKLREEEKKLLHRLVELEKKEAEFKELEERLSRAKRILPFLPYIDRVEDIERQLRDRRLERERLTKESIKIKSELSELRNELSAVENMAKEIPTLREELQNTLLTLEKLKDARQNILRAGESMKEAEELERECKKLKKALTQIETRIKKGESLIEETQRELEATEVDEERYRELLRLREKIRFNIQTRQKEKELKERLIKTERDIEKLTIQLKEEREKLKEAQEQFKRSSVLSLAKRIRESLREGDTCPVCGGVYHHIHQQEPEGVEGISEEELELIKEGVIRTEKELSSLQSRREVIAEELSSLPDKEERLPSEEKVEEELKSLEELRTKKREMERKLRKFNERMAELLKERQALSSRLERFSTRSQMLKAEAEKTLKNIREEIGITETSSIRRKIEALTQKSKDLKSKIEEIEKKRDELSQKEKAISQKLITLKTSLKGIEKEIEQREKERESTLRKLIPIFEEFGDLKKVKELSLEKEKIEKLEEEIERFKRDRELTGEKLKDVRQKLKGEKDTPRLKETEEKLESLQKERELLFTRKGELSSEIARKKESLGRKEEIKDRLKEIEKDLRVLERIKEDLKSDRLQDFAASLMLSRIVEKAGEYLLRFTGVYELHIDERGDLAVLDRSQGAVRSVSSLSGGETFLASLSLALGVSDILSARSHLESLFIDEGFGTLDDETRERVSDILQLVKQNINRMVGIISHIPDLGERFHQRIEVIREEDSSRVKVFY